MLDNILESLGIDLDQEEGALVETDTNELTLEDEVDTTEEVTTEDETIEEEVTTEDDNSLNNTLDLSKKGENADTTSQESTTTEESADDEDFDFSLAGFGEEEEKKPAKAKGKKEKASSKKKTQAKKKNVYDFSVVPAIVKRRGKPILTIDYKEETTDETEIDFVIEKLYEAGYTESKQANYQVEEDANEANPRVFYLRQVKAPKSFKQG